MESNHLVFKLHLTDFQLAIIKSVKTYLQDSLHLVNSPGLSISDKAISKYNHAVLLLCLIIRDMRGNGLICASTDLFTIKSNLLYVYNDLQSVDTSVSAKLRSLIRDQVEFINDVIHVFDVVN